MSKAKSNVEMIAEMIQRSGVITSEDVGDPGAGLWGPEQFGALWKLVSEDTLHPWARMQDTVFKRPHTGNLNRIGFGNRIIESAEEGVDTGNLLKPDHSKVPYSMKKGRVAFGDTFEADDQSIDPDYNGKLVGGFTEAFARSYQELAWLGDETSTDKTLKVNNGWIKILMAGSNKVNGQDDNGGDISPDHFYRAFRALPKAVKQRRKKLKWGISVDHYNLLEEFLTGRATGWGDTILRRGKDDIMTVLGIELVEVPSLTTQLVLTDPKNTTNVMHPRKFRLKKIDKGLEVEMADIVVWVGFFRSDFIIREVEAASIVYDLNEA